MRRTPIFRKIFFPVLFLMISELIILGCSIVGMGLVQELRENEVEVINEKVISRKGDIEEDMIHNWMEVDNTVYTVNQMVEEYLLEKHCSLETLCTEYENASEILEKAAPLLIDMMQNNRVNGAFLVLNTEDLRPSMESGQYRNMQGIYVRSSDPNSQTGEGYKNVLAVRSPISVAQKLGIPMDSNWDVNFDFAKENVPYYDLLYRPFQMAYENADKYKWKDMGCWSSPYRLAGDTQSAITYSVPLILDDGSLYGVLGIDIAESHLRNLLSNDEMGGNGTYILGIYDRDQDIFSCAFGYAQKGWIESEDMEGIHRNSEEYYLFTQSLYLYENNTPFSEENWVLAGTIPYKSMYSFLQSLLYTMLGAATLTILVGIGGSLLLSYQIHLPIKRLTEEMRSSNPSTTVDLPSTWILEIDQMSEALQHLSRDVVESSRKFSTILEMASTKVAGYQMNYKEQTLFVTEQFFAVFGLPDVNGKNLSIPQFQKVMNILEGYRISSDFQIDGELYEIRSEGKTCYIRLKIHRDGNENEYGLAEDITRILQEQRTLTYERDHDSLTNLFNRRAFHRYFHRLFAESPESIGIGVFIMLDLDNLKYMNDTYGHNYGDRYIMQAAAALQEGIHGKALYSRNSGDEFHVFLYGHKTRAEAERQIQRLRDSIASKYILLANGTKQKIQMSGGMAWYPQDSVVGEELARMADYAMYMVKRSHKGEIMNFDRSTYQSQEEQMKLSSALTRLIEHREVNYALQPIVDAHTGQIFAYEALMRPSAPEFRSVGEVLEVAKREAKLNQIEELTWEMAVEKYILLIEEHRISKDTYIFINSIPNQQVRNFKIDSLRSKYFSHVVLELTEEEQIQGDVWMLKQEIMKELGGKIALDDYGSGYNGEQTLLTVMPDFIKIDIAIVRGIHQDPDKQALMSYVIDFAHGRGKYVVAEGVENREELKKVIELGVDYLQGFYLARPELEPRDISEEALEAIRRMQGIGNQSTQKNGKGEA